MSLIDLFSCEDDDRMVSFLEILTFKLCLIIEQKSCNSFQKYSILCFEDNELSISLWNFIVYITLLRYVVDNILALKVCKQTKYSQLWVSNWFE